MANSYADGYGAATQDAQPKRPKPQPFSYTGAVNNMVKALMDGYENNPYGGAAKPQPPGPPLSLAPPPQATQMPAGAFGQNPLLAQPPTPAWPPANAAVPYSGSATMSPPPAAPPPMPAPMQPTMGVPYAGFGPLNTAPPTY
jgi:hypothetical protein